jgi:AcrR family transcriptional regulator
VQDEPATQLEGRGVRTRRNVIDAALSVVRERPLADVQLQHIAARAGISPGHVLYHFGSKDRILVETLRASEEAIAAQRTRELSGIDDPAARLARWIVLFLPRGGDDPTWKLWLEFWLRSSMDDDVRGVPRSISERWIVDLKAILRAGSEDGTFRYDDLDAFVTWAHSLLIGLSIGVLAGWLELDAATRVAFDSIGKELDCSIPRDRARSTRKRA